MRKIFKTCCLILIFVLTFSIGVSAADRKEINALIEQAGQLDGQKVSVQGEAIGESMNRGDYTWININDGTNAIGIWMKTADASKISHFGDYKTKGDIIKVQGVFRRACAEHGGEADIHSITVAVSEKGYSTPAQVPYSKIIAAILLGIAALVMTVFFRKTLKRSSLEL